MLTILKIQKSGIKADRYIQRRSSGRRFGKPSLLLFCCVFCSLTATAQSKYWVFFRDKPNAASFNPYCYFSPEAIERRKITGIPLFDYTDMPVNTAYTDAVTSLCDSSGNISRWFNAMGVWATKTEIESIKKLPFVSGTKLMTGISMPTNAGKEENRKDSMIRSLLDYQVGSMEGGAFRNAGLDGKGIRIAILDVGFTGADKHRAFEHLRQNHQVIHTWDFIRKEENVYHNGSHGTMVLSCIAGKYDDGTYMGLAPGAEFLLARTERGLTEWRSEEDNWVAAAEWADKNGAKIISSSLGYTYQRYFYDDMNGTSSIIARGANMAARKGILVVSAAGNDGTDFWKYICTPGDADSVLTVGGVSPVEKYHIDFSSYGPTADNRLKPNVCAAGEAWVATPSDFAKEAGTSFATPLTAGFAACAWEKNPTMNNMQLFDAIQRSGSLYPYFDYAHGYGIPQAGNIILGDKAKIPSPEKTLDINAEGDSIIIAVLKPGDLNADRLLYYHIAGSDNVIKEYYVIDARKMNRISIPKNKIPGHVTVRASFHRYTAELKL